MNRTSSEKGIRRSLLPGIRYPLNWPLSNHLHTVRGATWQTFDTWPVVNTYLNFITLLTFIIDLPFLYYAHDKVVSVFALGLLVRHDNKPRRKRKSCLPKNSFYCFHGLSPAVSNSLLCLFLRHFINFSISHPFSAEVIFTFLLFTISKPRARLITVVNTIKTGHPESALSF